MKATTTQSTNRTKQLIKASVLTMLTILLLSGGTAYASHNHHGGNSGLSITLGYVYYPKVHVYEEVRRYPRHVNRYDNHQYRGHHGHHKSWRNKHGYKHHGKHHGKRHHGHRDYY